MFNSFKFNQPTFNGGAIRAYRGRIIYLVSYLDSDDLISLLSHLNGADITALSSYLDSTDVIALNSELN